MKTIFYIQEQDFFFLGYGVPLHLSDKLTLFGHNFSIYKIEHKEDQHVYLTHEDPDIMNALMKTIAKELKVL